MGQKLKRGFRKEKEEKSEAKERDSDGKDPSQKLFEGLTSDELLFFLFRVLISVTTFAQPVPFRAPKVMLAHRVLKTKC